MKARKQTQDSTRVASDLRPSKVVPFLPIKAWYLGRKLFEEPYHLVWLHSGRLSIRSGEAPGAPPRHSENVDMKTIVSKFVNPADSQNKSVFFETNESIPRSGQKELGAEYSKFFKQGGKLCEGDIAIQFDSDSSNWSPYSYLVFVDWLKCNVDHRQVLGGLAGNAKWDVIPLITERVETKLRRGFAVDGTRDATTPTATRSQTKRKADDDATEESGCSKKIKVEET
ncbi:hypothetical protein FB45DRAFT_285111 [Roridomyces roridus]|uniref:Uncharacterized protein n=1 Tax=Roridomyces roridus TaxID=1738132 RepID=A0AAD7FUK6_9AGAR|nr:hypothetical protein FB45DRAFT_285111 [Roridomyces roridus]